MFQKSITKEEIRQLPLIKYDGRVIVAENPEQMYNALVEIKQKSIIGFDTETKPTFKRGDFNHVALIQMSTEDKAYLFRVTRWGLIPEMLEVLSDDNILKVGVALDNDLKQLKWKARFEARSFLDLNKVAESNGYQNIGLRNLSGIFLGGRISKGQQTSNWENEHLSNTQITYAATDAWASIMIYNKMLEGGIDMKPHIGNVS